MTKISRSWRLIGKKCVKEKFVSNIRFSVKEEFSVETVFIKKIRTLNKKVIEKKFSNKGMPRKKAFFDKKLVSNSISLSFRESQLRLQLNYQY